MSGLVSAIAQIPLRGPEALGSREIGFTPDGRLLLVEDSPRKGEGGIIRAIWWHPQYLITEACLRVDRNLSPGERDQYLLNEPYRKTCPNVP